MIRFVAFAALPPGIALREEVAADHAFLEALYASTRAAELAQVDWDAPRRQAFLASQFALQHAHYRQHYAGAEWLVIEADGAPAGRLYVKAGREDLRLMDVALVEGLRGRGLGTALTREVIRYADALRLPVTLHVEPWNPALRLYERLGFRTVEMRGIYAFMRRDLS